MSPLSEKQLEERLAAAGESLVNLPSSLDELLSLLDQIEGLLEKVEQSPAKSLQNALSPLTKALVTEDLLKHPNVDVKVGVASCISEITRITAPDAPYDDGRMKDVFQLIVSSFENLSDTSSRSYKKRTSILETVAKVRSCVIMLDLECDQMIIEMFQHFLKAIRVDHPEIVVTSMETVMTLVLEESEDISPDLLAPILTLLKRNNEAAIPIAKKLAERVIQNSADKLRPYLRQAVKSLHTSLDDYSEVVASLCRENTDTVRHSNESILNDQLVVEGEYICPPAQHPPAGKDGSEETNIQNIDTTAIISPNSVVSNGISETRREGIMTDANSLKTADSNNQLDAKSISKTESDDFDAQKPLNSEAKEELAESQQMSYSHEVPDKDVRTSPTEVKPAEAGKSPDEEESTSQRSLLDAPESDAMIAASPTQSGNHPDDRRSETVMSEKGKGNLDSEMMVSVDTASEKASEGDTEAKKKQHLGKKRTADSADKDKTLTEEVASRNNDGCTSDSEAESLEQAEKGKEDLVMKDVESIDTASKKASEEESISEAKKPQQVKKQSTDTADRDKLLSEEVASMNDDGCASHSEAQSLDQAEEGKGNLDMKEMASVGTAFKKASEGKSVSETKKQQRQGKSPAADSADKDKALPKEVALRNNYGCTSDSEARSLEKAEKGKGNLVFDDVVSVDAASKKAFEGESISEAKKQRRSGKKRTADSANKCKTSSLEVTSKNDDGCASDSEAQSLDQAEKGKGNLIMEKVVSVDTASKKASEREPISEAKKKLHLGRKRTTDSADMGKTLHVEVTSKNDNDCASDSEARLLDQAKKGKGNLVMKEVASVDTASKKASKGVSILEAKKRHLGKKRTTDLADMDKTLTVEVTSENDNDSASDSEARLLDQAEMGKRTLVSEHMISVDSSSKKASEGESISQAKKQRGSRKKQTADSAVKGKKLIVQVALKNSDDGCASDSEPRLLDQPKKLEDASNKVNYGSSLRGEDSKKSERSKHASDKDVPRSAREDHGKVTITSQKSPIKSTKNEQEETPRTSNKRKQTPGKEKASETPEYGKNLIGSKVKVWWPKDQMFYEGEIASFDPVKKKHKVVYTDGDEEVLNLKRERWEFVGDDLVPDGDKDVEHSSQDTSSDMKRKKKRKSNLETSSKRQKVEHSPKSKLKDSASKSGGKSKDEGKAEPESKDNRSKPSKSAAEDSIKSKVQTQKLGGGGQVDSTKAADRSKEEVTKISSHVKQDSERTSKSRDKTPQSSKTPGSGVTKLTKSSSSKVKETDLTREKSPGTAKSSETAKRKSADTAKSVESETKSGKKRRR